MLAMNGKGEGRTAALLLIAGFLTVVLAMVAIGTQYFPGSRDRASGDDRSRAMSRAPRGLNPSLADIQLVDQTRQTVRSGASAVLEAPGGIGTLELPPGAVEPGTEVQLSRFIVDHPNDLTGFALDLNPDGLQLSHPATLTMTLPPGVDSAQLEIAVYDSRTKAWVGESNQRATVDGRALVAQITHFSLRRIRIRPGMQFPSQLPDPRATVRLESDPGGFFERYVQGRWQAAPRTSASYRELVAMGRNGRLDLIRSGRLRAIAAPHNGAAAWRDGEALASLPPGSPLARTGWVRIERLDGAGQPTGRSILAEVRGTGPNRQAQQAGVEVELSRTALEQLGFQNGVDFGVDPAQPERTFMLIPAGPGLKALDYLPIRLTSVPAPVPSRAS
ncbi:MAG: hypothetical protein U0V87_10575 [Acidobacteriota bacterium]